jgi:hypothetical protein
MDIEELTEQFQPIFADIIERSTVVDSFIERDRYQLYIATLWANVVLDPIDVGLIEDDLEDLHEVLNTEIAGVLGQGHDITECFRFINTKQGERAMEAAKLTKNHKDLLLYFASMILDPEGHKQWMEEVSSRSPTPRR